MKTILQRFIYLSLACLFSLIGLTACSNHSSSTESLKPFIPLESFFNGKLTAQGLVKNRQGEITRTFHADINASWTAEGIGTLDEQFLFDDGEKQQRIWTLKRQDSQHYSATANDVEGEHLLTVTGRHLKMKYPLSIRYKNKPLTLSVDDRLYIVNDSTLLNESTLKKFGFKVGSILLVIQKQTND